MVKHQTLMIRRLKTHKRTRTTHNTSVGLGIYFLLWFDDIVVDFVGLFYCCFYYCPHPSKTVTRARTHTHTYILHPVSQSVTDPQSVYQIVWEYVLSIEHIRDTAHMCPERGSFVRFVRSFIRSCSASQRETGGFSTYMPTLSPDHRPFPPSVSLIVALAKNGRNQQKAVEMTSSARFLNWCCSSNFSCISTNTHTYV